MEPRSLRGTRVTDLTRVAVLRAQLERTSVFLDNHGIRPLGRERPAYSIVGLDDLKTRAHVEAAALHNLRQMKVENADPLTDNQVLVGGSQVHEVLEAFDDFFARANDGEPLIVNKAPPGKERVPALELMLPAPYPGWYEALPDERKPAWFAANMGFANTLFAPEAILSAVIHFDETTPQIHVIGVPVSAVEKKDREGVPRILWKLDKRSYRGATRASGLQSLQTAYNRFMRAEGFDLDRGKPNSKARRQVADDLHRLRSASDHAIECARELVGISGGLLTAVADFEREQARQAIERDVGLERSKGAAEAMIADALQTVEQMKRDAHDEAERLKAAAEADASAEVSRKVAEIHAVLLTQAAEHEEALRSAIEAAEAARDAYLSMEERALDDQEALRKVSQELTAAQQAGVTAVTERRASRLAHVPDTDGKAAAAVEFERQARARRGAGWERVPGRS